MTSLFMSATYSASFSFGCSLRPSNWAKYEAVVLFSVNRASRATSSRSYEPTTSPDSCANAYSAASPLKELHSRNSFSFDQPQASAIDLKGRMKLCQLVALSQVI